MAKLLTEKYEIIHKVNMESVKILVEINSDDEITLHTHDDHPQFSFTRSKADRVKAVGLAFQEAAELIETRKVMAG